MEKSITKFSGLKTRAKQIRNEAWSNPVINSDPDVQKAADRLTGCANWMIFNDYYTVGQSRLVKTSTCKQHMLCPFCASRRAAKLVQKNAPKVEQLLSSSELVPAMITLTVKNGFDLYERFAHLKSSFRTLQDRRRDFLKKQRGFTEFSKVNGCYFSYEITYTEEEGWHPHIHCVALLDDYIDVRKLSQEWKSITGDSFIVDVRKIKPKSITSELSNTSDTRDTTNTSNTSDPLLDGLFEVFKYAMKFQDLEDEDVWHAWQTLRGQRLIGSFGSLHGLKVPESLLDDPLADLPFIERHYSYIGSSSSYSLKKAVKISEHGEVQGEVEVPQESPKGDDQQKESGAPAPSPDARGPALLAGMENPSRTQPPPQGFDAPPDFFGSS